HRLVRIRHLIGCEERNRRLIARAVHAPVPGSPANRALVDALVAVVLGFMVVLGEKWRTGDIGERGCRTSAGLLQSGAALLHRKRMGRPVVSRRVMAGGARHGSRGRQSLVEE